MNDSLFFCFEDGERYFELCIVDIESGDYAVEVNSPLYDKDLRSRPGYSCEAFLKASNDEESCASKAIVKHFVGYDFSRCTEHELKQFIAKAASDFVENRIVVLDGSFDFADYVRNSFKSGI
jgi:hypothetical protein